MPYQKVFADVRVVNPTAKRYERQSPDQIMESNANEKKRHYCRRVLEVENATFCPLIFTTNGGIMGRECIVFYNRLAQEMASKWGTSQIVICIMSIRAHVYSRFEKMERGGAC